MNLLPDKNWMPYERGYRNPLKLEVMSHVVPLIMLMFFLGIAFGYAWAMHSG